LSLLLVDATNVTMRYAYAQLGVGAQSHPDLNAFERVVGGAEYACRKVARQFGATHAVLCFDSDGETFRHKLFPDYKKSRPAGSFKWSKTASNFMSDLGWKCVAVDGFEGDDIVATIAHRAHAAGKDPIIFSGDCDLLQLAGIARCVQFGQKKEPKYVEREAEWVRAKYDVLRLDCLPMWKALCGDSGDDIPGIFRVGPKKARDILGESETCHIDKICECDKKIDRATLELMLQLVSLRTDVPIAPLVPSECRIPESANGSN
jgi:5'-3' exonuclease